MFLHKMVILLWKVTKMDDVLAIITLDQNKEIINVKVVQEEFKFGCIRCADLCCKLGGPKLTERDAEKIKAQSIEDFLAPKKSNNNLKNTVGSLKIKKNGSCIFLQYESKISCHICNIYDFRPTLCKLYPFKIENLDSNRIAFKFIPCCKGLNNPKGKILDREFFLEKLEEALKVYKITK